MTQIAPCHFVTVDGELDGTPRLKRKRCENETPRWEESGSSKSQIGTPTTTEGGTGRDGYVNKRGSCIVLSELGRSRLSGRLRVWRT